MLINLRAYPSGTDQRFTMLILTAGAQAWIVGGWYSKFLPHSFTGQNESYAALAFSACIFLLAYIAYLAHPALTIRLEKLREANAEPILPIKKLIEHLARTVGCAPPIVMMSSSFSRQSAKVFGVRKRKYLKMDAGLAIVYARAPEKFEAIILHEIEHINNRDIFKGYYARCLFWTSLIIVLPMIIYRGMTYAFQFIELYPGIMAYFYAGNYRWFLKWHLLNIPPFLFNVAPFVFIQAVLLAEYCAILRSREHYADWGASIRGAKAALITMFENGGRSKKNKKPTLFRNHPDAMARAEFVHNPGRRAFEISGLDAFLNAYIFYTLMEIALLMVDLIPTTTGSRLSDLAAGGSAQNSFLLAAPILSAAMVYATLNWSRMIQKFSAGEWLRKASWSSTLKRFFYLCWTSSLGVFAGELFWPERIIGSPDLDDLKDSMLDALIFLPSILISAYFVFITTRFGIARSEGNKPPKSLFIIGHVVGWLGLNIGLSISMGFKSDQDVDALFMSWGVPFVQVVAIGILDCVVAILLMLLLLKLLLRKRHRVSPEAIAPAWLILESGPDDSQDVM